MCVNSSWKISENLKDFKDSKNYIRTFGGDYFVCLTLQNIAFYL